MTTKSPTTSVKLREVIGGDQFTQRREVFDKHDTVFLPLPSPTTATAMSHREVPPVITSNHGKTTANFKRNAPAYSSMRESRTEDRNIEFRTRKYSDNFNSEFNQSDDVDYRYSMTERTRRLSKMRRDFLNSNLHEPTPDSPFARTATRASMPVGSAPPMRYKIESPNLFKFPFAEPYATPPPVRRVVVDLGPVEVNGEKEPVDVEYRHQSLPNNNNISPKVVHHKLFEDLLKRYSPERKPIDWKLPPTRPRVVGSVPKSTSSMADSLDSGDKKVFDDTLNKPADDDVFDTKDTTKETDVTENNKKENFTQNSDGPSNSNTTQNGPETLKVGQSSKGDKNDSKSSLTELEEKNDEVPELSTVRQSRDTPKRPSLDKFTDLSFPALIDKITEEGEDLESHVKETKKVKRKRSFLDKLLGRKKKDK